MITAELVFLAASTFQIAVITPLLLDESSLVPRETSVPTTIVWFVYAATYFSISYPLAGIANVVGGSLWALVAIYRHRPSGQTVSYDIDGLLPGS